jgi:hypothetical protein
MRREVACRARGEVVGCGSARPVSRVVEARVQRAAHVAVCSAAILRASRRRQRVAPGDTAIGDVSHGEGVVSAVSVVFAVMVSHGHEVTGSPRGAWWRRAGSTRRHWAHAGNKEKDVGVRQESSSECVGEQT